MRDVLDYKIEHSSSLDKLQERVRVAMNKGWTIWGGVHAFPDETLHRGTIFAQVLVKFAPEK